jgi:hypothetical protein
LRAAAPTSNPSLPPTANSGASGPGVEPPLETGAPPPAGQQENAEAQLTEDDRIDDDFTLVLSEPVNHFGIGHLLGWLAEDVSVDKIFHSVSVDSESIGRKKPFSGQASSQSTTLSFRGADRRFESVLTAIDTFDVELLTGFDPVLWPISAGSAIWPFDETVVFIGCKIESYSARSRNDDATSRTRSRRTIQNLHRQGGRGKPVRAQD